MLPLLTLCTALQLAPATLAAPATRPMQAAPPDTTRKFRGYGNNLFAWGTLQLRKGPVVRAFLPVAPISGLESAVLYYLTPPEGGKLARGKIVSVGRVQTMRVDGQYWEVLRKSRLIDGELAARLQTGSIDLFLAAAPQAPLLSSLGANPVLSSPADASVPEWVRTGTENWYLRRPNGTPVLVTATDFASQVAGLLHDAPELARRVATAQPGYRFENLESIIRQYNQQAPR